MAPARCATCRGRWRSFKSASMFFFEKKNQKTFVHKQVDEVFLLLFVHKKKILSGIADNRILARHRPSLPRRRRACDTMTFPQIVGTLMQAGSKATPSISAVPPPAVPATASCFRTAGRFMAGVGLRAGGDIIETFAAAGLVLVVAGICVTMIPIFVGYLFGRKVLKIHPVLLFGGITGSMTSGASLSVVTKAANSSVPSLGYTGAYAFANVLLTIAGSIILFF